MIPLRDDQPVFSVPFINYFLIGLNVLVFVWEQVLGIQSPGALQAAILQFGLVPRHTVAVLTGHSFDPLASGIVPIFTSMFLHGGFWHVAFNMLFLWIFGDNVEDYLGHFRYLFFYLSSGIAGSIVHIFLNINSPMPTVGASGAIAGVMGGYFILYPRARVLVWFPPIFFFHLPAWLMLGFWFLVQFFSGTMATVGNNGVAVWAHIGGFVAGIVMIKAFRERPHRYRYGTW
jgi:membrane associated rhomboid family serine protease